MVQKVLPSPILPQISPRTLEGVISTSGVTTRQTLDVIREHARAINALIDDADTLGGRVNAMGVQTTYTPTVWPDVGAFGALGAVSGCYARVGSLVFLDIAIDITTAGTAGGGVRFSLPVTVGRDAIGTVREVALTGYIGWLQMQGNTGIIARYDNAGLIGNGYKLRGNGFYWSA